VNVQVYLSPYDVPEAVSRHYDEALKRFVIEFRYPGGGEPLTPEARDEYVTLQVGRNSGRICRIEIDVNALQATLVGLSILAPALSQAVDKAIEGLARAPTHRSREGNYRIAKRVVTERGKELFEELAGGPR
jgi:hypothetical protein